MAITMSTNSASYYTIIIPYLPVFKSTFYGLKEAPKLALDLYTGERFRAKFQLNNLLKINIIMVSLTGTAYLGQVQGLPASAL